MKYALGSRRKAQTTWTKNGEQVRRGSLPCIEDLDDPLARLLRPLLRLRLLCFREARCRFAARILERPTLGLLLLPLVRRDYFADIQKIPSSYSPERVGGGLEAASDHHDFPAVPGDRLARHTRREFEVQSVSAQVLRPRVVPYDPCSVGWSTDEGDSGEGRKACAGVVASSKGDPSIEEVWRPADCGSHASRVETH